MAEPRPFRAAIYLRVSTEGQAIKTRGGDSFSLPAQRDACLRRAEELEAAVIEEYIEPGESARSSHRPEFQRLLRRAETQRDLDYIIVHKLDRFMRNTEEAITLHARLRRAKVSLHSATEHFDDSPSGRFQFNVLMAVNQLYSDNLSHEVRTKALQKARQGGTVSKAPIGYLNVRERVNG